MMNPILKRTLCGLGVGALVIGLFLYCPLRAIMPIILVLSTFAQMEFYAMAEKKYAPVTWFGILIGGVWIVTVGLMGFGKGMFYLLFLATPTFFGAFLFLCLFVLFRSWHPNPVGSIAVTLMGFLYVPFLLSFFLLMAQLTAEGWWGYNGAGADVWISRAGLYTLFALIAVAKFSDTGGFAFGMAFGKHKMCPTVSPKKSWEGLAGSMVFSAVTAAVMLALARHFGWGNDMKFWNALTYPVAMGGGALLAIVATVCDLIESRFKREFDIKDSSMFLPAGMGGLLDMFDSVLFIPAIAYPIIVYFSLN